MRRNKKATTKHSSSSIWRCAVTGVVEHSWIHLLRSSPAMRRTLSAGNSAANVGGRAGRPALPAGPALGDKDQMDAQCLPCLRSWNPFPSGRGGGQPLGAFFECGCGEEASTHRFWPLRKGDYEWQSTMWRL